MGKYKRNNNKKSKFALILVLVILSLAVIKKISSSYEIIINAISNFFIQNASLFYFIAIILGVALIVSIATIIIKNRYKKLAYKYSVSINKLIEINSKYNFFTLKQIELKNKYDNAAYYEMISPLDYLTYSLVEKRGEINGLIANANKNNEWYGKYANEVNSITDLYEFSYERKPLLYNLLLRTTKRIYKSLILKPKTSLSIEVTLYRTNINGKIFERKSDVFNEKTIKQLLSKLSQNNNGYYYDDAIWESISKVERGKVSNKIRFSIFKRDGNKCKYCGSTKNLEVDHIVPISKGGKTVYDNLQTLCHNCNSKKSNTMPYNQKGR